MSNDKATGNNTTWVEFQEPVADAKTDAIKEAIDGGLDAFERHKEELLDGLRRVKRQPFDEDKAWRRLTSLAGQYVWRERVKQGITKPAARKKRLRGIANALERARDRISEAMQNDVGDDLSRHGGVTIQRQRVPSFAMMTGHLPWLTTTILRKQSRV